ncbi:expressed unknown protein [Seminavis robusta]|uniref:Uncharacterized protein n=1 Tax=Seminavis robusta TaxID=568900 RepID=A0A9N8EKU8_9STRA|nr:expressed unknown protein [Seminavis robusta]|eukprot:Sro1094_g240580.1 n/a (514) ;mRNA; f:22826-24367
MKEDIMTPILLPDRETVSEERARELVAADLKLTVPGITRHRESGNVTLIDTKWPGRVVSLLQQHPKLAAEKFQKPKSSRTCLFFSDRTEDEDGFYPLAYLLLLSEFDNMTLLKVVIDLYPQALLHPREKNGNLLLHDVCGGHCRQRNPDLLVPLLVNSCPGSAATPNAKKLLPLQLCRSYASLPAIQALVDAYPQGLCHVDPYTGYTCFSRALTASNGRPSVEYMLDKLDQEDLILDSILVAKERKWPTNPIHVPHLQRLLTRARCLILRHVDLQGEIVPSTITSPTTTNLQVLELCDLQLKNGGTADDLLALVSQLAPNLKELTLSLYRRENEEHDVTALVDSMLRRNIVEKLELRNAVRIRLEGISHELKINKSLKTLYCEDSLTQPSSRKLLANILEEGNDVLQDVAVPDFRCTHSKRIVGWTRLNWCGRRNLRLQDDTITLSQFTEFLARWKIAAITGKPRPVVQRGCHNIPQQYTQNNSLAVRLDPAAALNVWFCFLRESADMWSYAY